MEELKGYVIYLVLKLMIFTLL